MLGSRADAEDIIQEAYVRWHEVEPGTIDNLEAWLVTTTRGLRSIGWVGLRPSVKHRSVHG
jgi:DNA-directed RNA polymerase specialized sigma24 family protein